MWLMTDLNMLNFLQQSKLNIWRLTLYYKWPDLLCSFDLFPC